MSRERELLEKAAAQFRFYQEQHKAKVAGWERAIDDRMMDEAQARKLIADTTEKARVNGDLAKEIEDFLSAA